MALTTTQVNQAFLGLLGRPATGAEAAKFAGQLDAATLAQTLLTDASFKNELSVETLSFKTVDLLNTDPAAFVESLYTALLGRASDAEGKAFWLSVAGITPNRADVVSQFIAAVQAQEGSADANAFATIQAEDKALANAWVESLYNNLAGRASDAEGLDFWTNAIVSFAMTPAQVAASFAAALALQGNTTEDGQNYLAKQGVADNFTANFKDFNNLLTANEKATSLNSLVTMMNGVNKDSQVEQYTEEITKFSGEYQNIKAIQFTTKDDDNLGVDPETGEPNTTSGVNFTGTVNLTDETKGTIQSSDSVTGNENYKTDTLTINVIGYNKDDNTKQTLDLNTSLPSVTSVERLNINNGAATVDGALNGFDYITVNGTGKFNITGATSSAGTGLKDIVLSSGATKEGQTGNTFNTGEKVQSFKSTNGDDKVTLAGVEKSIETGAGKDNIAINGTLGQNATLDAGAGNDTVTIDDIAKNASIKLGAGDDELTIKSTFSANGNTDNDKNIIATIDIDAGTGVNDKLTLQNAADSTNTDLSAIKSIKGVEKLVLDNKNAATTAHTLKASAISGQSIELSTVTGHVTAADGFDLILDAKGATNIDLSKLKNGTVDGVVQNVSILVKDVKSGTLNLEPAKDNQGSVKETISLDSSAKSVVINNFEAQNDKITIAGATNTGQTLTAAAANLTANSIYGIKSGNISVKSLNDTYFTTPSNLIEKDVIYLFASDSIAVDGKDKSYQSKIYKVTFGSDKKVSTVELMATVNQSANKSVIDPTSNTTVVTDPEVEPTVTKGVVLSYDDTNGKSLDLTANKYTDNQPVGEDTISGASAIYVNAVSGDLTITGNAAKTVIAHLSGTTGVVKKAGPAAQSTVQITVGGKSSKDAEGNINTVFTAEDITIAKDALLNDDNGTVEVFTKQQVTVSDLENLITNGNKLSLVQKEGLTAVSNTVNVSGVASGSVINLADTFLVDTDKINLTVASGKAVKSITGTASDDTITLVSGDSISSTDPVSIDGGSGSNTLQLHTDGTAVNFTKITTLDNIQVIDLYNASNATSGAKVAAAAVNEDTITLKSTAGSGNGTLTIEMVSGDTALDISKFTNDTASGIAGVTITGATSGDTITLSQATGTAKIAETVDLTSITSGAATVTNAHKAEDTVKFAATSQVATAFANQTITETHGVKKVSVLDTGSAGQITFANDSGAVTNLTITQVQELILAVETASSGKIAENDVVFYKDAQNIVYLINVGTESNKDDDTVVILGTMDVAKITAATNVISFA